MGNIELNIGGLIGALVIGGVTAAIIFATVDTTQSGRAPFKLIIGGVIGGAFAGNFLWAKLVKKA